MDEIQGRAFFLVLFLYYKEKVQVILKKLKTNVLRYGMIRHIFGREELMSVINGQDV